MCHYSAETLKCQVIDWLIANYPGVIIGNEVMYGTTRKVVDLLAIYSDKIWAIEIKSHDDNLKRLSGQLKEYRKIFDKTIVVTSSSHINESLLLIGNDVGLYSSDKTIKKVKPALSNHDFDKQEMLYSISSRYLKSRYPAYKSMNSDKLRTLLSKKSKSVIHELLVDFYRHRITERYKCFFNERGVYTHVDDIPVLSSFHVIE